MVTSTIIFNDSIIIRYEIFIRKMENDKPTEQWNKVQNTIESRKTEASTWMDKIIPHKDYYDASAIPYGVYKYSPFCPLEKRDIEIDGTIYNSCEQFVMAKKAIMFGDTKTLEKIMEEKRPQNLKHFDTKINNVDQDIWNAVSFDVLTQGNYQKFNQHADLKNLLLGTGNKLLVQCKDNKKSAQRSRSDATFMNRMTVPEVSIKRQTEANLGVLGSEVYLNKRRKNEAHDINKWTKNNTIGQSLMIVRKRLVDEEENRIARFTEAMSLFQELKKK